MLHVDGTHRLSCRYCQQAVRKLVDTLGWGVVVLHDAKGMFDETHPAFIGTYSPFYTSPVSVRELYEAADAILFVGGCCSECCLRTALGCCSHMR
jgi:TPP-dependent 2-oxoacid decarboxylase